MLFFDLQISSLHIVILSFFSISFSQISLSPVHIFSHAKNQRRSCANKKGHNKRMKETSAKAEKKIFVYQMPLAYWMSQM